MMSNRESAKRSRIKKQQHLDELIGESAKLKSDNAVIVQRIDVALRAYLAVESENNVLRAQLMELTDRLRSLNSVLRVLEEVSGVDVEISRIPDDLTEPWQLPCAMPRIMMNSDVFEF